MRVIFMGKNKPAVLDGLRFLIRRNIDVAVVVAPGEREPALGGHRLADVAREFGIPTASDEELYTHLSQPAAHAPYSLAGIDLVISFLFWRRIRRPLIDLPRLGCINFHPAPLPEFRGYGVYSVGICSEAREWGVSAHFVDETIDTGDIIEVRRFDINPRRETALSLEQKSQRALLELFEDVIDLALSGAPLPRTPQGEGRYTSRQAFEEMRRIMPTDTPAEIERKVRAFWYPPYRGATIEIGGQTYTLVHDELLTQIGSLYHQRPPSGG